VRAHAEYAEANKDVKRSVRTDKIKYIEDLAKESETAASQHNMKTLYDTTKQMSSRFKASNHQIKDLNGHLLTTTEDQNKRWVEHSFLIDPLQRTPQHYHLQTKNLT